MGGVLSDMPGQVSSPVRAGQGRTGWGEFHYRRGRRERDWAALVCVFFRGSEGFSSRSVREAL